MNSQLKCQGCAAIYLAACAHASQAQTMSDVKNRAEGLWGHTIHKFVSHLTEQSQDLSVGKYSSSQVLIWIFAHCFHVSSGIVSAVLTDT